MTQSLKLMFRNLHKIFQISQLQPNENVCASLWNNNVKRKHIYGVFQKFDLSATSFYGEVF